MLKKAIGPQVILETKRLIVREFTANEEQFVLQLKADTRVNRYTTPATPEETKRIFQQTLMDYKINPLLGRWAIISKEDQGFVGTCMLARSSGVEIIELGYILHRKYWGKGIATEIAKALVDFAFNEAGLTELYAVTDKEHKSSQKVLYKSGFEDINVLYAFDRYFILFKINNK